jgi:hypothetical protein
MIFNENMYSAAINAAWTRGTHSLRFGASLDRRAMNHWQPQLSGGRAGRPTSQAASRR